MNTRLPKPSRFVRDWICSLAMAMVFSLAISTGAAGQITTSFTEPIQQSEVAAAEPGIIVQILVEEGQHVRAGDILARLDQQVLVQNKKLAELRAASDAQVNGKRAVLRLKKMQLENLQNLIQDGHANVYEVEELRAQVEVAQSELSAAEVLHQEHQLAVEKIQAEIERRTIRSPIAGIVTELHKNPGEYVSGADPRFATVVKLDQLKVRFYLGAEHLQHLKNHQTVRVLTTRKRQSVAGRISFVSPVIDPQSETGRIEIVIANPQFDMKSGIPCYWPAGDPDHDAKTSLQSAAPDGDW